ncbi:MAG: hypothetical protein WC721_11350 [Victivallaceae bacterium]
MAFAGERQMGPMGLMGPMGPMNGSFWDIPELPDFENSCAQRHSKVSE